MFVSKVDRHHVITYIDATEVKDGVYVWIKDMHPHTICGKKYPSVLLPQIADVLGLSVWTAESHGYKKYLCVHVIDGEKYLDCNKVHKY